jgi:hypothetical protein
MSGVRGNATNMSAMPVRMGDIIMLTTADTVILRSYFLLFVVVV